MNQATIPAQLDSLRHEADAARSTHDDRLAVALYGEALTLLAATSSTDLHLELALRSSRAASFLLLGDHASAERDLVAITNIAERLGQKQLQEPERANQALERRVADLSGALQTASDGLEQRTAELALVNSVQQGLVTQLDMQAMYDLVGDKIQAIFDAQVADIAIYDQATQLLHFPYAIERGVRYSDEPIALIGFRRHVIETCQLLMITEDAPQRAKEFGNPLLLIGETPKSALFVPLALGDKAFGVISLQNLDREHAFSDSDARLLSTLAASLSVALENARLFAETRRLLEETEQRNKDLATINTVSQAIAGQLNLAGLIELTGEQLRATFRADIVYVALLDHGTNTIHFPYCFGEQVSSQPLGIGLTSHIIATREPLLINDDIDQREQELGVRTMGRPVRSYLGVPIIAGQQAIGVVSVQSVEREDFFDTADVQLLNTIAANVGAALQNAQLYAETEQRAAELAALADVGNDISATLDLPVALERIAGHALRLLAADTSAVFLATANGQVFRASTVLGADATFILDTTIRLGEGIIGDLAQRGVAEIIRDLKADPRARQIPGTGQEEHEQMLAAPLLAGRRVIGIMAVWRTGLLAPFTEANLGFLVSLARQATVAIENARLFTEAAQAREAAESASNAKGAFLANMSHELRTPLNAVLGFTQVLERDLALGERQREYVRVISRSGEHLLGLINDVLEVSKIEAGRLSLSSAPFDLHDLLDSVAELFRLRAESKGLQLITEIAPEVPHYVEGDEGKLRQVLLNLLGNAVKFTVAGGVSLRAGYGSDDQQRLTVEVADSGEGIGEEQLPRLFEAFTQTDSGLKNHEGSGLGLSISRQYVRLMGGEISVSSRRGEGSVFGFDVKLPPAHGAALQRAVERRVIGIAADDRREYRLLVVDDRWESRRLLVEWLSGVGFAVREAANGAEAIAAWEEWEPQLIWMDIRMPVMDGYEATKRIKSTLKGQATVVIALTASAFDHERMSVLSVGCDDFVRKPVREEVVFAKLSEHLGVRFVYEDLPPKAEAATRPSAQDLTTLPAELQEALRSAALVADLDEIRMLTERVRLHDDSLAEHLTLLAASYQIDQLQQLVQASAVDGAAASSPQQRPGL